MYNNNVGGDFGRYAAFFRNYKHEASSEQIDFANSSTDVGQYKFGDGNNWQTEFLNYTSGGNNIQPGSYGAVLFNTNTTAAGWAGAWDYTSSNTRNITKVADQYPNQSTDEEEVWFIDAGKYTGTRWNYNSLHWDYICLLYTSPSPRDRG